MPVRTSAVARSRSVLVPLLVALAACTASAPSTSPDATAAPTTSAGASSAAPIRPNGGPRIWFAPLPPATAGSTMPDGSVDFRQLFVTPERWSVAGAATDVVKLYSWQVEYVATPDELRVIVEATRARGQAIAIEIGPLTGGEACGLDVEGFNASFEPFRRIRAAGGSVAFVAFDEPYAFGHAYSGDRACGWTVERVAQETAAFVRELRKLEPGVRVGDIEPQWPDVDAAGLAAWLDAYEAAGGEPFDFLHLDVDWSRPDWRTWVAATASEVRARGIDLGVIYNGGTETSDAAWLATARANAVAVEALLGGPPETVIFQSWMPYPKHLLPDTDVTTFTGLIRQYATAGRTVLTLDAAPAADGTLPGVLRLADGSPVAGAAVVASATPLAGGPARLSLSGTVPAGARTGLVGLRVNTESASVGAVTFSVDEIAYSEDAGATNLVPDPRFVSGARWDVSGSAEARFTAGAGSDGRRLAVHAAADQDLVVNGREFPVTPGRAFTLSVSLVTPALAEAPPDLVVVFLDGAELERRTLTLRTPAQALPTVTTDADGRMSLSSLPEGARIEVRFAGDLDHWPSAAARDIPAPATSAPAASGG